MCLVPAVLAHYSEQALCLCLHKLCPFGVVSVAKQVLVLEQHIFARNKIIFRKKSCAHVLDMVQIFKAFLLSSED